MTEGKPSSNALPVANEIGEEPDDLLGDEEDGLPVGHGLPAEHGHALGVEVPDHRRERLVVFLALHDLQREREARPVRLGRRR